jgi:hypothetical protein
MERVIAVSLSEWVAWLQLPEHSALAAFLALSAFLALYGATRRKLVREEQSRLEYVNSTLDRYAAAAGSLMSALELPPQSALEQGTRSVLRDKLLACRAAPYSSENLLAQIAAFAEDGDVSRLPLLLRTLERESESLIAERDKLLRQMERPGWGSWLWRVFRPVLPAFFASAFFITLLGLWRLLDASLSGEMEPAAWDLAAGWMQLASCWFALLLLYLAVMGGRNRHVNAVPARLLASLIAVLAAGHLAGSGLAPYVLGAQLLLFLGGFRLNRRKPRKARPYVGHDPLSPVEAGAGPGDAAAPLAAHAPGRPSEGETPQ